MKGTVKKYITARGYGFIDGEDGISYFFHISDTNLDGKYRYALEDVEVEFEPVIEQEGLVERSSAINVVSQGDILYPDNHPQV